MLVWPLKESTTISMGTTAMSWAISTPMVMRPIDVLSSSTSSSIWMATAVEEIATMKPSATICSSGQPSR